MGEHVNGSPESVSSGRSDSTRKGIGGDLDRLSDDRLSAERQAGWFDPCSEGLFRIDLSPPVDVERPASAVVSDVLRLGVLQECNAALLPLIEGKHIDGVLGSSVQSFELLARLLHDFVLRGGHLENRLVVTSSGRRAVVSARGVFEGGELVRVWGRCRRHNMTQAVAMLDALERQKQEIGLELHDGIGQLLTAVRITSQDIAETLRDQADNPLRHLSLRLSEEADEALRSLREITRRLSPAAILRRDTLKSALEALVAKIQCNAKVECRLEWYGNIRIADDQMRVHAYRIVQEAINNAVKHSQADVIAIVGRRTSDGVVIAITDDGIGFARASSATDSIGIESLQHRAAVIGADLTITSTGEGTEVSCFIPNRSLQEVGDLPANGHST